MWISSKCQLSCHTADATFNVTPVANLSVPYGLILRSLDYRRAAWYPTHMSHLDREERKVEKLKPCKAWTQEVEVRLLVWLFFLHSHIHTYGNPERLKQLLTRGRVHTKPHAIVLTRFLEMLCLCSHFADSISHRHIQLSREPVHSFLPSASHNTNSSTCSVSRSVIWNRCQCA